MHGRFAWHYATANSRNPETPVERSVGYRVASAAGWLPFPKTFYGILAVLATPPIRSLCEPTENGKGKCNAAAGIRSYLTKGAAGGRARTKETRLDFSS